MIKVSSESPDKYKNMPPGLSGYWWETEHLICVPLVEAKQEGDGTFTKWLTVLDKKHKTIFFPTIVSGRLDFILRKHGYQDAYIPFEGINGLAKEAK